MRIAIDAMGGDHAPGVIVEGAAAALQELGAGSDILLVGQREVIELELDRQRVSTKRIAVIDARDVVEMGELPSATLRKKKGSSIAVGLRLHAQGQAQGFISAGNTGAVAANALFILGRIAGVERPAIATYVPNKSGGAILLDVGASIDCKPSQLVQFAVMGACHAATVLRKENPAVGLLNIGEENTKGTEVIQEAYRLLRRTDLNFIGNVEGRDLFAGTVDVVVCDGFVGNVVLKFAESVVDMVYSVMKETMTSTPRGRAGALLLKPAFSSLRAKFDYAEYGGAPLLGVDGVCIICHGSSSARAIKNAVLAVRRYVEYDIKSAIGERLSIGDDVRPEAT